MRVLIPLLVVVSSVGWAQVPPGGGGGGSQNKVTFDEKIKGLSYNASYQPYIDSPAGSQQARFTCTANYTPQTGYTVVGYQWENLRPTQSGVTVAMGALIIDRSR
jgi:predicted porin